MFEVAPEDAATADELALAYLRELREIEEGAQSVDASEPSDVHLAMAATMLAGRTDGLDSAAVEAELLDRILIEMSNAVLDVDTLAAAIDLDRSGKELQQRIEGRAPMTLQEYAAIRHGIAARRS